MALDPLNYPNKSEYMSEVLKLEPYVRNTDAHYRDEFLKTSRGYYDRMWDIKRKALMEDPATAQQYEASQTKGAPWAGGAEVPEGLRPGEGGLPKEASWDQWFAANVGKPLHRITETGLGFMAQSQGGNADYSIKNMAEPFKRAADIWRNPGHYPAYRKYSGGDLIESPEGQAVLAVTLTMPELLGSFGWAGFGEVAPEAGWVGQVVNPAIRFGTRAGAMGLTGAAVNAPKSVAERDPTPSILGFAQGAGGQALSEVPGGIKTGAYNIFGRRMMRTSFGKSLAEAYTRYFPEISNELRGEADFKNVWSPKYKDANGTAVSLPQKIVRAIKSKFESQLDQKVGNQTVEYEWQPGERQELYGDIDPKTGQPVGKRGRRAPGQYVPGQPPKPGRAAVPPSQSTIVNPPLRVPKGQPGAGRMIKMGSTKQITVPGRAAVAPSAGVPEKQIMTVPEARRLIQDAEQLGYDLSSGGPGKRLFNKTGVPTTMRGIARRMARVLGSQIENMPGMQGWGVRWEQAYFKNMFANIATRNLNEEGVIQGTKLGVPELQSSALDLNEKGYYHDYVELLGEKDAHDFLTTINNGADPRASTSVHGRLNPYVRQHLGPGWGLPTAGLHLPTLPYFAGPAGPAAWKGMFRSWGMMFPIMQRYGANMVARMLLEASGMDEPAEDTPVLKPAP